MRSNVYGVEDVSVLLLDTAEIVRLLYEYFFSEISETDDANNEIVERIIRRYHMISAFIRVILDRVLEASEILDDIVEKEFADRAANEQTNI